MTTRKAIVYCLPVVLMQCINGDNRYLHIKLTTHCTIFKQRIGAKRRPLISNTLKLFSLRDNIFKRSSTFLRRKTDTSLNQNKIPWWIYWTNDKRKIIFLLFHVKIVGACVCICVSEYVCVRVAVCVNTDASVEVRSQHLLFSSSVCEARSLADVTHTDSVMLAGQWAPRSLLVQSPPPLGSQARSSVPRFSHRFWELNSGPYAWTANPSLTEPFPSPTQTFWKYSSPWICN